MDENVLNRSDDELLKILVKSSKDITLILNALAHKKRLLLVTSLLTRPRTFNELREVTGLAKTALAHHIKLLVKVGVVNHTGRGQYELSVDGRELLNAVGATYACSRRRKAREAAKRADYIGRIHTKEGYKMKEFKVEIVELEPMRVASAQVTSTSPEHDAWELMRTWAEPRGLLEDLQEHPVFGFNSPDPTPGQKEYGYEFWIRVDSSCKPEGKVKIKDFDGGLYAVTTCNLKEEMESEFFKENGYLESWKKIVDWVNSSKYTFGKHQCLEKAHDPGASEDELILDLYCPIEA